MGNKTDLVSETDLNNVTTRVQHINSSSRLVTTRHSRVDVLDILDLHAYDGRQARPDKFSPSEQEHIESDVSTVTVSHGGCTQLASVELFLQKLLWDEEFRNKDGNVVKVFRLKGLLALSDREEKVILQGVHDTYDTYTTQQWGKEEARETKIVLIGRNLDKEVLQNSFTEVLNS